jgi:hypothetical protein
MTEEEQKSALSATLLKIDEQYVDIVSIFGRLKAEHLDIAERISLIPLGDHMIALQQLSEITNAPVLCYFFHYPTKRLDVSIIGVKNILLNTRRKSPTYIARLFGKEDSDDKDRKYVWMSDDNAMHNNIGE